MASNHERFLSKTTPDWAHVSRKAEYTEIALDADMDTAIVYSVSIALVIAICVGIPLLVVALVLFHTGYITTEQVYDENMHTAAWCLAAVVIGLPCYYFLEKKLKKPVIRLNEVEKKITVFFRSAFTNSETAHVEYSGDAFLPVVKNKGGKGEGAACWLEIYPDAQACRKAMESISPQNTAPFFTDILDKKKCRWAQRLILAFRGKPLTASERMIYSFSEATKIMSLPKDIDNDIEFSGEESYALTHDYNELADDNNQPDYNELSDYNNQPDYKELEDHYNQPEYKKLSDHYE